MDLQARWCKKSKCRCIANFGKIIITRLNRYSVIMIVSQRFKKKAKTSRLKKIQGEYLIKLIRVHEVNIDIGVNAFSPQSQGVSN